MRLAVTALVMFFLAGCATPATTASFSGPIPHDKDAKAVEKAIQQGAVDRGWTAVVVNPGLIEATLNQRAHIVTVNIKYDKTNYTVEYKDSRNMDYNEAKQTIHRKYPMWVSHLKRAIDKRLTY